MKRAKSKGRPRPRHTIWCREALSAAQLLPPEETEGQACWACGRAVVKTMFGYQPTLAEIHDAYGRVCLCTKCIEWHMAQLMMPRGCPLEPKQDKGRKLPTYDEWLASADISEMQAVLDRMKARMKR